MGEQQSSLDIFVNTAVSKLESVLFAPLQGFPYLGANAADEALNFTSEGLCANPLRCRRFPL